MFCSVRHMVTILTEGLLFSPHLFFQRTLSHEHKARGETGDRWYHSHQTHEQSGSMETRSELPKGREAGPTAQQTRPPLCMLGTHTTTNLSASTLCRNWCQARSAQTVKRGESGPLQPFGFWVPTAMHPGLLPDVGREQRS